MTFSDAGVVDLLKKEFIICWQSVCDVRRVEFDLGNGRKTLGILNGELAVHVCDTNGKSFKIIPGLRSPVEMANKLVQSVNTFKKRPTFKSEEGWQQHIISLHQINAPTPVTFNFIKENLHSEAKLDIKATPTTDLTNILRKAKVATQVNPIQKTNVAKLDFDSIPTKSSVRTLAIIEPSTTINTSTNVIVNPGNTPNYDIGVANAFLGTKPITYPTATPWDNSLKTPKQWTKVLFEGIMKQKMQGGSVKYESVRGTPFTLISE